MLIVNFSRIWQMLRYMRLCRICMKIHLVKNTWEKRKDPKALREDF